MQLSSLQKISQKNKIPPAIIGLLPPMFAYHYTHNELDDLFIASFAPPEIPVGSKPEKVKAWLRAINMECEEPLEVLGNLLGNFLEKEYYNPNPSGFNPTLDEKVLQLQKDKRTVLEKLKEYDLEYQRGGHIIKNELNSTQELQKAGLLSTEELQKLIAGKKLSAVEIEIKRALENIEKDPREAVLFAANLLEASCKAYLDHHSISYKNGHTLRDLWKQVVAKAKIHPDDMKQENLKNQDLDENGLKMIASGLYQIVNGTMNLRNKKGAAHGHSEKDFKLINLKPRHARLTFNAAHSLSMYILELMDQP
ncbi:abortive infection family protein [Bartonella taylorii]|uniref:Abortive infection family protein n=1 Tax=Bartonella taylorii TaxID=33046 RepID=A0A9Q8YWQ1_BARTA|nr:abortive infection family protein [Bartonella taylorii]USP02207.1 abortive infection family protein [Bartonella taylorii]